MHVVPRAARRQTVRLDNGRTLTRAHRRLRSSCFSWGVVQLQCLLRSVRRQRGQDFSVRGRRFPYQHLRNDANRKFLQHCYHVLATVADDVVTESTPTDVTGTGEMRLS